MLQQRKMTLLLCLLVAFFIPLALGVQAKEAFTTDNLIRFHVVANSDQEQDQHVKYIVRDRLIEVLKPQLNEAETSQEARKIIADNSTQLAAVAKETVAAAGYSYGVRVELGKSNFPPKAYGDVVLQQGEYEALRVVLGEGKGANWWCVLFPPLCFVDISATASESEDSIAVRETMAQQGKSDVSEVDLRFRLLDWIKSDDGYLAKDKGSQ
ncbi:MAG: stage II sporulation protein R [Syntrophaceticus sp.]|jgi:stage II sporulation protein R|nr:stage II sporulation protein R [Syntrophaceticus sp.]MDD4359377.1 stage II sporulation protein R [Syntrophaceticus sp.]MDD4782465.1 stage II sporulation protein R [Syntrophaceticus sp.]